MQNHYVDIHCHPSLKPFSKSFKYEPSKQNALDSNRKNSIWHYSPPNFLEKFINRLSTLTKFTQTDFTALAKAKTKVVIVSLYPFEKHFFDKNILGLKGITDLLVNLTASISQSRMDYIRSNNNYFADLLDEYNYYEQLHNQVAKIDGIFYTYRLVSSYAEIQENFTKETDTKKIINVIITIEGGHSFNTGLDIGKNMANPIEVIQNIKTIKNWKNRPLFITFAHHFYNELCGHARSITIGMLKDNQNRGLDSGITDLGLEAIKVLLDNTEGKRIPIDVKHMSVESRKTYYKILETQYAGENIPIIASHGAANGKKTLGLNTPTDFKGNADWFCDTDINFYDDEFIRIAKSNGIFGIQLDERRIGSKKAISESKIILPNKRKQLNQKALLVWRQVEHMAELLDREGLFCWGIQSIGSDFDGIVNPINGLWTAENMKDLAEEMVNHAKKFLDENRAILTEFNRLDAETVVERVMHENAMEFIKRNY